MPFQGRSVQGIEKNTFGGLDEQASLINLKQGFALDMNNWEIDGSGAVQLRDGFTEVKDLGADLRYLGSYYTTTGDLVYVAVCDNAFWEATTLDGTWTNRTGSVTLTAVAGPWIGTDLQGRFFLTNGTDPAITHKYGENATTLKNASRLSAPEGLTAEAVGTPGATSWAYAVTGITASGETPVSNVGGITNGAAALTGSDYVTLVWDLLPGAQGYKIYRLDAVSVAYNLIGVVGSLTTTFDDTGQAVQAGGPPLTSTAYNTPSTWDGEPPDGFFVMARGRAQRIGAWRRNAVWFSALSDGLDWNTSNDAFQLEVLGGRDNRITAAAGLYDFTILFSRTNTFVYTGSTYSDISQSKILNVGCEAPHSLVSAGDDLYFWSEFGPNLFSRVQAGQDIQSGRGMSDRVVDTVQTLSNRTYWVNIVAFNHIVGTRLGWVYPNGSDATNSKAVLFNYDVDGWSRHTLADVVNVVYDELRDVYAGLRDGRIVQLYEGTTDDNVAIAGTYETGWYDSQSMLNRVNNWLDLVTDKSRGNYSFTVDIYHDFATTATSTHTLTQAATDGITPYISTTLANIHRVYVAGLGKFFKLKFTVTSSTTAPRIEGWRPEMHSRGTR